MALPNPDHRLEQINIHQLMEKVSSKRDVYNFLTQEGEAYLPKMDTINIFFLKQITRGEKDIEGLTVEDFLKYARKKPSLLKLLPDEKDWNHLDKKWVCDVLYTHDTVGIQAMINAAALDRRKKQEKNQDMLVEMRPEFVVALRKCANFGSSKGKAAYLLKESSKKKRSREEMEEVKAEEELLNKNKQKFLQEYKQMKKNFGSINQEAAGHRKNEEILNALHNKGVIDKSGNPVQMKPQQRGADNDSQMK